MTISLRKVRAEAQIKHIEKQLEAIHEQEAQDSLNPIERTDETFVIVTNADEKKKLQDELEKCRKIVAEESK
ncbi:MAG TPA: hypothetical protein DCZ95_07255 [Verrucomicrobia bacterium]|nr:MAG: hypothetical protein A2X46_13800 [Lentisphaerae bacterium GWF2_57_35]HBA83872.1 hypothetical protein [Verrucomicrobiota bacterium]